MGRRAWLLVDVDVNVKAADVTTHYRTVRCRTLDALFVSQFLRKSVQNSLQHIYF